MRPEKQRIAIAEACGWAPLKTTSIFSWRDAEGFLRHEIEIPDYLNDLNAMHEAEKILTEEDQWKQILLLAGNPDETKMGLIELRKVVRATAAQRAEAFLKIIGKWENE